MTQGTVQSVGAVPGAPDLMTVRAQRAVEQAEVLIWADSLVAPEIAALAPANCERLRSGNLTLEAVMEAMLMFDQPVTFCWPRPRRPAMRLCPQVMRLCPQVLLTLFPSRMNSKVQ